MSDDDRITELERLLTDHFADVHKEMDRRDRWLIHSIWGVVRSLSNSISWLILFGVAAVRGWSEWWQIVLVVMAGAAWTVFANRQNNRLYEQDLEKIGRDSSLDRFWGTR